MPQSAAQMKKPKTKQPTAAERLGYYRDRNARIVSFVVDDVQMKEKLAAAAEKDGRSVNSWLLRHVVPLIEKEVERQMAPVPKSKAKES